MCSYRKRQISKRTFCPNYALKVITEKFYAQHDNITLESQKLKRISHFSNQIEKRLGYYARKRYKAPITTNQTYGWLEDLAEKYTGLDEEILMHRLPFDDVMNILKQISIDIIRDRQLNKLISPNLNDFIIKLNQYMFKRRRRPQVIEDRIYRPNYGIKIITEKFYARHDNSEVLVQDIERYKYYANELDKRYKYDARDRYYAPITTNQTYGWLERLADRYTGQDRRILFRRVPRDNIMHILNQVSIDINRELQLKKL